MENALIKVCEHGNYFGNMLINYGHGIDTLFNRCISLLYNYNKNLYKVNLPKEILAIRFFQESEKDGKNSNTPAELLYDSEKLIRKLDEDYTKSLPAMDGKYGAIGIARSDRDCNEYYYSMSATIDIGTNTITFYNIGTSYSTDCYKHTFWAYVSLLTELSDMPAEYDEIKSMFKLRHLNILEDFYHLLKNNTKGFILPSGRVFVPTK